MQFEPLPASLNEVDAVVTLWTRARRATTRLTGSAASEAAFKAAAAGRQVLHLATHGFFLGGRCATAFDASSEPAERAARLARENPLLLSGLILAGAHREGAADEDGVLTAEEIAALNLNGVELGRSCPDRYGRRRDSCRGGCLRLRRAFQLAGAKTVIMSLWTVEDQATRQWMSALYENRLVRELGTADAVREASLTMLRQRRAKGVSTHPLYWAAFVAAGDWR